ncbi:MAG: MMPL family transporter [Candidatus Bipolaricaulota bacterium]|nr:MMPL family transporter [Candidatus Bipolaricaulota bacterium]
MRAALLGGVYRLVRRRAWFVLLSAALLSSAALLYIRDLPMRSSFEALLPPGDPVITIFQEREEIITKNDAIDIILSLQNPEHSPRDVERLQGAAEQIVRALTQNPQTDIVSVSFTKDIQTRRGDELLSLRDEILLKLRQYQERLRGVLPASGETSSATGVPGVRDLVALYAQINTELERIFGAELDWRRFVLNPLELVQRFEELKKLNQSVKEEFDRAPGLIQNADHLVADLLQTVNEITETIEQLLTWPQELYLSRDGTRLLVKARPRFSSQHGGLAYSRTVTRAVQETLQSLQLEAQGINWELTGPYVIAAETNYQLNVDMRNTTIISAVGVMLVIILTLRRFFYPILALIVLFLALIATLAWAKFSVNGLNLVTSFLPPLILGLGIDYGINFIAHFLHERRAGHRLESAIKSAIFHKGSALITASLATACVLLGLMSARSPGLYEMGIIAGVGVLIALLATLLVLPALMLVSHIMLRRWLREEPRRKPEGPKSPDSNSTLDSLWRFARWPIVLLTVAGSLFMLSQAVHVEFRFADEELVPKDLPAKRAQQIVRREFDVGTAGLGEYFLFFAPTLDELRRINDGLTALKAQGYIDAVASLLMFLPSDPAEADQFFRGVSLNLERDLERARTEIERQSQELQQLQDLTAQIARLKGNFTRILDQVALTGAGANTVAPEIQKQITQLEGIEESIQGLEAMQARLGALRDRLTQLNERVSALLHKISELQQVQGLLKALPKDLQERFVTEEREFIVYAHLKRTTINEPRIYSEFISAVRTFSNDYLGYPMIQDRLERTMKRDFQVSTLLATAIILTILAVGMSWRWALVGIVPVGLGFLWMLGTMRLSGLDFNFANIIISSLLIGNGVDYAVYMLHSFLEDRRVGLAWKKTAAPIVGSALTTMVSFGSLLFAATPGLRVFGLSALYGIGFTMLFTLLFLPALLSFARTRA